MGDPDSNVSEEDMEKSNDLKRDAVELFGEGKLDECIAKYTEAIKLNAGSALLYAKRGQVYLRLKKPNACIRDCNRALQINQDSAVAYKFRGRAHRYSILINRNVTLKFKREIREATTLIQT